MIVMDLEWNSGVGDGKSLAEILQIGAVKYDRSAHKIVDTFSVFIHPCVHSEFSVGAKALPQRMPERKLKVPDRELRTLEEVHS